MLPHVIPYDRDRVMADQPWLTYQEHEQLHLIYDQMQFSLDRPQNLVFPEMHYILTEDGRIVEEPNFMRWAVFMDRADRQIHLTKVCEGKYREAPAFKVSEIEVSTVFYGASEHELFETIIFGGWLESVKWRNATLIDAKKCHWEAVYLAREHARYMKKHGRRAAKDWKRIASFWRMAHRRGESWMKEHWRGTALAYQRLSKIPGRPNVPSPHFLLDIAQLFIPRPTLVEDPLVPVPDS